MNIKSKVFVYVLLPTFIFFGVASYFEYTKAQTRVSAQVKANLQNEAQQYANRIDALVREASAAASTTANALSANDHFSEEALYDLLRRNLKGNSLTYGSAIAFEPHASNKRTLFSPYVFRSSDGLKTIDIAKEAYDYTQPQWEWYNLPKAMEQAVWTEPYFDRNLGNINMVTFSAPFFRHEQFAGVATVDLDIGRLLDIAELPSLDKGNSFVISHGNHYVYHPDKTKLGKSLRNDNAEFPDLSSAQLNYFLQKKSSRIFEYKTSKGKVYWLASAPINSANWSFVVRLDGEKALTGITRQLRKDALIVTATLALASLIFWFLLTRMLNPISKLAQAVEQISEGNLEVNIETGRSDEISQLANSFSTMAKKLAEKRESLLCTNRELEREIESHKEELQKRIHAEQVLAKSEEKFAVAFRSNPSACSISRLSDGHFLDINKTFEELLGYSRDDVVGKIAIETGMWVDLEARKAIAELLQKNNSFHNIEVKMRTKFGNISSINVSGEIIELNNEQYVLSSFIDITERKRTEIELANYREHLQDLVKMRTQELEQANLHLQDLDKLKSMFIASMSHELRTPLNSIIGFSGVLIQGLSGALNADQKSNLQRIHSSGRHLLAIITDIIDISKIEAGYVDVFPESFKLKDLVDEAIALIIPMANGKEIALEVEATSWPVMVTDRKRVLQCLLNYLSNAVKFSEKGTVLLSVSKIGDEVEIAVKDNGIGISENHIHRLFEPFERIESHLSIKAGGTGLGLYLTKKIARELLRGDVSVESELHVGSTFSLRIPMKIEKKTVET